MKIIFAGTPQFAATALREILKTSHEVVAVYTQPDRKSGRGQKLTPSAVKEVALANNLPVYQPLNFKNSTDEGLFAQEQLKQLKADVMIVAAYGLILPQTILDAPKYGCLNIHASLLPRWRGAAPIQRAIQAGDEKTGITIMQMAAGLDTGDIMYKTSCPITEIDTSSSLHDKLAEQGASAIKTVIKCEKTLIQYLNSREKQKDDDAIYAHKLNKIDGKIDWTLSSKEIYKNIRAFTPWPMSYIALDINLKVISANLTNEHHDVRFGTILNINEKGVFVACGQHTVICLTSLQWPGGKALSATQIMQNQKLTIGQILI